MLVGVAEDVGLGKIRLQLLLLLLRKHVVKLKKIALNALISRDLGEVKIEETSVQSVSIAFLLLRLLNGQFWSFNRSPITSIYNFIDEIHGINSAFCIQSHFSSSHFV